MAERRMFNKKITESDAFLDMPLSTQCLYFHLNMAADDDGFVNNPKKIQRMIGCSSDDIELLKLKGFVITFESGVIVIKHWRMHNYIQNDRYKPTDYAEEKALLRLKENKSYTVDTNCIQVGYTGKDSIDKDSIDKDSIGKYRLDKDSIGEDNKTIEKENDKKKNEQDKPAPKKVIYFPDDELLEKTFKEFRDMRKSMKKPMTDGAIERMISRINKLSPDAAVKELQRSIDHNWLDIYPDKKDKPKSLDEVWNSL